MGSQDDTTLEAKDRDNNRLIPVTSVVSRDGEQRREPWASFILTVSAVSSEEPSPSITRLIPAPVR